MQDIQKPAELVIGNKSTSIRLSERTKRMLESVAKGRETHEETVKRLIELEISLEKTRPLISANQNTAGVKYERVTKETRIKISNHSYHLVYQYNDLSFFRLIKKTSKMLKNPWMENLERFQWRIDVEIINIKPENGNWKVNLDSLPKDALALAKLVLTKNIIETEFETTIYELQNEEDYFSELKWSQVYDRLNLPSISKEADVYRIISVLS